MQHYRPKWDKEATLAVGFHRYLKENKALYIDHRLAAPAGPGVAFDDAAPPDPDELAGAPPGSAAGGRRSRSRRRRGSGTPAARFRQVRPVFLRSAWSDPLPYEEPWERAFR